MGIVQNTVKVPHGLAAKALTTTNARTASKMIMISSTPTRATPPATGPISERTMSALAVRNTNGGKLTWDAAAGSIEVALRLARFIS